MALLELCRVVWHQEDMVNYKHSYSPSYNLTTSLTGQTFNTWDQKGIPMGHLKWRECARCICWRTTNLSLTIYFHDVASTNPPNALPFGNNNLKDCPQSNTRHTVRTSDKEIQTHQQVIQQLPSHIPDVRQNILRVSFPSPNWNRPIWQPASLDNQILTSLHRLGHNQQT